MRMIRWDCEVCKKSKVIVIKESLKLNSFLEKLRKSHREISPGCKNPLEELRITVSKMLSVREVHDILIKDGIFVK